MAISWFRLSAVTCLSVLALFLCLSIGYADQIDGTSHSDNNSFGDGLWRSQINGTPGDDRIRGLAGDDLIFAGNGGDILYGDEGSDRLHGENGNDYLDGGHDARDYLYGGPGADLFVIGISNRPEGYKIEVYGNISDYRVVQGSISSCGRPCVLILWNGEDLGYETNEYVGTVLGIENLGELDPVLDFY